MGSVMKVGYVVKMYPRVSETFIVNEILEMENRGVEVIIFSLNKPDEGRFHSQVSSVKAPVYYLDARDAKDRWRGLREHWPTLEPHKEGLWEVFEEALLREDPGAMNLFFAGARVAALSLELGVQHIHAHFASTPSTVAFYAGRIAGLGFSFTAHAKGIFRNTVDSGLLEDKIHAARFVSTVTQFNANHIRGMFPSVPPEKTKVVYNGIDLDRFRPAPDAVRRPGLILSIGRLVPKKGLDDLVAACAELKDRGVAFHCVIVGEGEERGRLTTLIDGLGLAEHVHLVGAKTQAEVQDYLQMAGVFVLPCRQDPDGNQDALPTVLLEAMASGCPVVSTTISGVPEIIDAGIDGLLVSPQDPSAIASAIDTVLAQPKLAERLAAAGRHKAEDKFDVTKNVAKLEALFREAISPDEPLNGRLVPLARSV